MRSLKISILFLIVIIVTPFVINTVSGVGGIEDLFELVEERENELEENKEREELEDSEEYDLTRLVENSVLSTKDFDYFASCRDFTNVNKDVLLEPPEAI